MRPPFAKGIEGGFLDIALIYENLPTNDLTIKSNSRSCQCLKMRFEFLGCLRVL